MPSLWDAVVSRGQTWSIRSPGGRGQAFRGLHRKHRATVPIGNYSVWQPLKLAGKRQISECQQGVAGMACSILQEMMWMRNSWLKAGSVVCRHLGLLRKPFSLSRRSEDGWAEKHHEQLSRNTGQDTMGIGSQWWFPWSEGNPDQQSPFLPWHFPKMLPNSLAMLTFYLYLMLFRLQ